MRTLNYVVLVLVLVSFGFMSFGCGESDSPTAPSSASSTTMAEAPSFGPSTSVRTTPASFTPDNLKPSGGARTDDEGRYNAYDFYASWDGAMLSVRLVEDNMRAMREASRPHRTRRIEVQSCPAEPGYHGQRDRGCVQIWSGSLMLSGTVNLDPIPLEACPGWLTVHAAELSDDKGNRNGYRNAPCPADDETEVGSDGSGDGWPSYPDATPKVRTPPAPVASVPTVYTLPLSLTDPTSDYEWVDRSGTETDGDPISTGGSTLVDLVGLSISAPDSDGWMRVTFSLAGTLDVTEFDYAARFNFEPWREWEERYPSWAISWDSDNSEWRPRFRYRRIGATQPTDTESYLRSIPGSPRGSSFSFEVKPPPEAWDYSSVGLAWIYTEGSGVESRDYIRMPNFVRP